MANLPARQQRGASLEASGLVRNPPPARPLSVADLVGVWTHEGRSLTRCVDRDTGAFLGDDSITIRTTWTFLGNGLVASDSFGLHGGRMLVGRTLGSATLTGDILDLKLRGGTRVRYAVRDWLESTSITVLKLDGPWYGDVPADVRAGRRAGRDRDQCWIRARP
jgi:hypothetical protein